MHLRQFHLPHRGHTLVVLLQLILVTIHIVPFVSSSSPSHTVPRTTFAGCDATPINPLLCPTDPQANVVPPSVFDVTFHFASSSDSSGSSGGSSGSSSSSSSSSDLQVHVNFHRGWDAYATDRVWNLVALRYYNNCTFFNMDREGKAVLFGINGDPEISQVWELATLPLDSDDNSTASVSAADGGVIEGNQRGYVSMWGGEGRTTVLWFNLGNNSYLDTVPGFKPIGLVSSAQDLTVLDSMYAGYGTDAVNMSRFYQEGATYIQQQFPLLLPNTTTQVIASEYVASPLLLIIALAVFFVALLLLLIFLVFRYYCRRKQDPLLLSPHEIDLRDVVSEPADDA